MTRISFIMPTFNRAHLIAESLQSVLSQMGGDDELLVIDDGSTDGTQAIVKAAGSRARYERQDNAGKSVALNRAMKLTSGELVWICDDDDILCPGAVQKLSDFIEESGADFVFGRYTRFSDDAGTRTDLGTGYWPDLSHGSLVRHILEDAFVMQNAALVRRRCYNEVGPFDETMLRSLDYDMFVRLSLTGTCAYIDALVFEQRKHEGARGPARALHAAADSNNVWIEYDRRIFERALKDVPLNVYQGMFESADRSILKRAAILQRACVSARHDLWPRAIEDLEAAARIAADKPLQAVEGMICGRILAGKHGSAGANETDTLRRLRMLSSDGAIGAAITDQMFDGVLWRLRNGEPHHRKEFRRLLISVLGVLGAAKLLIRRGLGGKQVAKPGLITERDVLARQYLRAPLKTE